MELVKIKWVDSHYENGWMLLDEIEEAREVCVNSVGYLLDENKSCIRIAMNVEFGDDGSARQVCDIMTIPKCSITKRKIIK